MSLWPEPVPTTPKQCPPRCWTVTPSLRWRRRFWNRPGRAHPTPLGPQPTLFIWVRVRHKRIIMGFKCMMTGDNVCSISPCRDCNQLQICQVWTSGIFLCLFDTPLKQNGGPGWRVTWFCQMRTSRLWCRGHGKDSTLYSTTRSEPRHILTGVDEAAQTFLEGCIRSKSVSEWKKWSLRINKGILTIFQRHLWLIQFCTIVACIYESRQPTHREPLFRWLNAASGGWE